MSTRIYEGHLRRYLKWCTRKNLTSEHLTTLETYQKFLTQERHLTLRYIKGAITLITRRLFTNPDNPPKKISKSKNKKSPNYEARKKDIVQTKRGVRTFTPEEYRKIIDASYANYHRNEIALLILVMAHRPDIRPQIILEAMNDIEQRADFMDTLPASEEKMITFVKTVLTKFKKLFPRKHNTYLIKLKRHLKPILGRDVPEASFEMLRRTGQLLAKRDKLVKKTLGEQEQICIENEESKNTLM